jgi:hypothetical protein
MTVTPTELAKRMWTRYRHRAMELQAHLQRTDPAHRASLISKYLAREYGLGKQAERRRTRQLAREVRFIDCSAEPPTKEIMR